MSSTKLGIMGNNVIIPYTAAMKRTKVISLTTGDITAGTNFSNPANIVGNIVCYADSSNNWKANVNVRFEGTVATATACLIGFPKLVFKARSTNFYQAVSVITDSATYSGKDKRCYTSQGASTIVVDWTDSISGPNGLAFYVSFDVELNEEPTSYTTGNMEGVLAADVFIAPAIAGTAGLVNNTASNTLGTPILGKTDGAAVATGYVGEIKAATLAGISQGSPTIDTYYDDSGTLSLGTGSWDIILYRDTIGIDPGGVTGNTYPAIVMALRSGTSTLLKELTVANGQVSGVTFRGTAFLLYSVDIPASTTVVYKASCGWYKSTGSPTLGTIAASSGNTAAFYAIRRA